MQLVFEFGSNKSLPVVETIRRVMKSQPYAIECLARGSDTYESTNDSLESAAGKLQRGEISAFSLRPLQERFIRYALVMSPSHGGEKRSFYLGTIEYLDGNYLPIWNIILDTPELTVAALGFEEGVELHDADLSEETFPWNQWPLVIGALRHREGESAWITGEGPQIKHFDRST
jgi:hypothetical protein